MANDDQPLDLSLPEMERKARKRYLELLASRPDYLGCWDCLMVFSDALVFTLHYSVHDPTQHLTCTCGTSFLTRADFQHHIITEPHSV